MIRRMLRNRTLEQSFALATTLLVVVLLGATMTVARIRVASTLRASMVERGASVARSIGAVATPSLLAYNYVALQAAAEGAATDEGVLYVVIQDKEGGLAGAAGAPGFREIGRSAVGKIPAIVRGGDVDLALPDGAVETVLEVAVPVRVEGAVRPWGAVRVGLSYDDMKAELRRLEMWLVILGFALVLAASLIGRWLAGRITAPLRRLVLATEDLSAGRLDRHIPVRGARELAELARSFNAMVDRIRDKAGESEEFQQALESLNATLEEQVRDRTRALQESVAQYKSLVEHSPDAILIVQEGRIRFVNRSFLETYRLTADQALSPEFDIGAIFEPSSAAMVLGRIEAWERGKHPGAVEVLGRDPDGSLRHLQLRGSHIEFRGRSAAECILVDTTEETNLRNRLTDTERLRALGELAGGVAHDFNNQLSAVLGRVQLLRRRGFDVSIDAELAVIEKAAQDGRETVRRIQEFARTQQDLEFFPVDLSEILQDAVEMTRSYWDSEARRRNVKIRLEADTPTVPPILGKDSELREVFTNLILNAVDAMPQGGTLRVACDEVDGRVRGVVSDTGVGMTEEIRRHLFDPFFTTKGQAGTGLGLSMVYGIVSRHEGEVSVVSEMGRGSTFVVEIPIADAGSAEVRCESAEDQGSVKPARILIIDDEQDIAEILREILIAEGHEVETALRGADGLKLATLSRYDLVFTDLGMPDMSGWEVAKRLRDRSPSTPVVLVTGWGASLDDTEVRNHHIRAVIHKPFDIRHVVQATGLLLAREPDDEPPVPRPGDVDPDPFGRAAG